MIRKDDVQWWALEAKKHPEAASQIIEELSKRLLHLNEQNEHLRDEIIRLQGHARTTQVDAEMAALRRKVRTLQDAVHGKTSSGAAIAFLSERQQGARLALTSADELARRDTPVLGDQMLLELCKVLPANLSDGLLMMSNHGREFKLQVADIPAFTEGIV